MTNTTQHWTIFRHGLATLSKRGYGDKIITAEVLPEGIPPVRRIGAYLKGRPCDFAVRSEFLRCQQTADIVTEITGQPFISDPRLNEMVHETFEQIQDRVYAFVQEMRGSTYSHIWVCTHGIIIAALKSYLLKGSFARKDELDYVLPGQLLLIEGKQVEVMRFDEVV